MNEAELSALRLAHAKEIADIELRRAQDVNRWAEKVVERDKEIEGLQAELASRPVVESEAARKVRAKCEAAVRSGWEAIPELAEWLAEAPTEAPQEEGVVRFRVSPDGKLTNIDPLSFVAQRGMDVTPNAVRFDLHDVLEESRPTVAPLSPAVDRLTPLEQAAVELAEAFVVWNACPQGQGTWAAFDAARDRYLALRDGEHVTEKEKPAPHQPETVDVWLAQYADGQIYSMPEGLHGVASHQTAARFIRVRLPVVEVVENETGGAA